MSWKYNPFTDAFDYYEKAGIFKAQSEPDNPATGKSIIWMSNGTGLGDAGDLMIKINVGGIVKYATIVDYSAATSLDYILDTDGAQITDTDGSTITGE